MLFILAIGLTAWCRCHDMDFSNHSRVQFANFCFLLVQFSAFVGSSSGRFVVAHFNQTFNSSVSQMIWVYLYALSELRNVT